MLKNRTTTNYIIGTISLIIGGFIYIFFRQEILAFQYIEDCEWLKSVKIELKSNSILINWIIYSLPDALWYFSLLIFSRLLYTPSTIGKLLMVVAIIYPFALETSQLLGITSGTFCFIDLTSYLITLIIYLIMRHKKFLLPVAHLCIIGFFGILAMGSSSQDVRDFQDGYREGFNSTYEYLNSENIESDKNLENYSINYNDSSSFAMSDVK